MEEETIIATRYWCHMCSQRVNPVMEAEIKCPFCRSGFIEEMSEDEQQQQQDQTTTTDNQRTNSSLWAPILMELMTDPSRRRNTTETDLDSQLEEIRRRRRIHSAAVLQLLQGIRAGLSLESEGNNNDNHERVIVINPFNQTITVQNSVDVSSVATGSLGDYFIGPGFEALLRRLAENDPSRYGTPPARKEDIEALATVKVEENIQCSVCLDEVEIGNEVKEMPCKHKFHGDCLIPWLELHSSCPVCRYQLPTDETKTDNNEVGSSNGSARSASSNVSGNSDGNREEEEEEDEDEESGGSGFSILWPFSSFFSSSRNDNASGGSS